MRSWFMLIAFTLVFAACQPGPQKVGLSVDDYVAALRDAKMHGIRVEANKKLATAYKAPKAVDMYISGQHFIVIEGTPDLDAKVYDGLLQGYAQQKWILKYNKNLALVAEPETQKTIIEIFEGLH